MKKRFASLTIFILSFTLVIIGTTYLTNHIFGYGFLLLWHLILVTLISIIVSITIKKVFALRIHLIYIIALSSFIISIVFFLTNYTKTCTIDLSNKPVDKLIVFVWNGEGNNLQVSNNGVIYISYKTYKNGFRYKIIKNGVDITNTMKHTNGFIAAPFSNNNKAYFLYKTLNKDLEDLNNNLPIKQLIDFKYVDTSLLYKQKVIS